MRTVLALVLGIALGAAAVWFYNTYRNDPRLQSAGQKVEEAAESARDAAQEKLRALRLRPEDIKDELARSGKVDGVIALGVLIRGATPHFEYIAAETTKGLAQAALASGVPVSFGVLTTDNLEQALERAGTKAGNKGWQAALAVIEMVQLYRRLGE